MAGACLAATLSILLRHPELHPAFADGKIPPVRFTVIVGGFPDMDPARSSLWSTGLQPTASLHIIGRGDAIVSEGAGWPSERGCTDSMAARRALFAPCLGL
jgi:hypothetical protein